MRDLSNVGFNLIPDVYLEIVCVVKGHSDFPSSMFTVEKAIPMLIFSIQSHLCISIVYSHFCTSCSGYKSLSPNIFIASIYKQQLYKKNFREST